MRGRRPGWLIPVAVSVLLAGASGDKIAGATDLILVHSLSGNIEPCGCGENVSGGWANLVGQVRPLRIPVVNGGNFLEGGALDRITAEMLREQLGFRDFLVCLGPDEISGLDLLPELGRPYVCASVREESADVVPVGTVGDTRITSIIDPALASAADPGLVDPLVALGRLTRAMDQGEMAGIVFLYAGDATRERLLRWVRTSGRPILVLDCLPRIAMPVSSALGRGMLVQCAPAGRQFVRAEVRPAPARSDGEGGKGAWRFGIDIETTAKSDSEITQTVLRKYRTRLEELVDETGGSRDVVGTEACRRCHVAEYERWSATGHAGAFELLTRAGKATQVRCYMCHITDAPLERATAWLPSLPANGDLRRVGCESCHGPGGKHARSEKAADIARPSARTCAGCHTRKLRLTFSYEIDLRRASCQPQRQG